MGKLPTTLRRGTREFRQSVGTDRGRAAGEGSPASWTGCPEPEGARFGLSECCRSNRPGGGSAEAVSPFVLQHSQSFPELTDGGTESFAEHESPRGLAALERFRRLVVEVYRFRRELCGKDNGRRIVVEGSRGLWRSGPLGLFGTRGTGSRSCLREVCRLVLLVWLTMSLLRVPVLAASVSGFEEPFRESELAPTGSSLDENELETIGRSIVQGLGLRRIPDPAKANVSQAEYERAHREYLRKVQLSRNEEGLGRRTRLQVFRATEHPGNRSRANVRPERYYRHSLFFPVSWSGAEGASEVEHATLRLLLDGVHDPLTELDVHVYLRTAGSRELLVRKRLELPEPRNSRWIEFDSTVAASTWLASHLENLGLEVEFWQNGTPVRRTFSSPVLNVFTLVYDEPARRRKRSSPEELMSLHKGRRTKCKGESKKCCRHELTVMFKDLKGFEFIVYPKMFDAGYCKGRCPPRYNPAHHHALLQSLLWKEDRKRVPKPCCAPSKLDQLMIVYFDENDSTELKISYWKNIQVLECACS